MSNLYQKEKRNHPRINTNLRCWIERDKVTLFGTITNMSSGGLFLRTPVLLNNDRDITLSFSLTKGVVTASGSVQWARAAVPTSGRSGLGIRFTTLKGGQTLLRRFITEQINATPITKD